jgi:hypothetical protein
MPSSPRDSEAHDAWKYVEFAKGLEGMGGPVAHISAPAGRARSRGRRGSPRGVADDGILSPAVAEHIAGLRRHVSALPRAVSAELSEVLDKVDQELSPLLGGAARPRRKQKAAKTARKL